MLLPRKYWPDPAIEPVLRMLLPSVPAVPEKSTIPLPLVMNRALPPSLLAENWVRLLALVVMVALPAVLESVKDRRPPPLLVMVAVAAVLKPVKVVAPGVLLMKASPAVAVLSNCSNPRALIVGEFDELLRMPAPVNSRKWPFRSNV